MPCHTTVRHHLRRNKKIISPVRQHNRWIRNKIVYDPNIPEDIFTDNPDYKREYMKGKGKRKRYFGV